MDYPKQAFLSLALAAALVESKSTSAARIRVLIE
jgi:hypothetical protein